MASASPFPILSWFTVYRTGAKVGVRCDFGECNWRHTAKKHDQFLMSLINEALEHWLREHPGAAGVEVVEVDPRMEQLRAGVPLGDVHYTVNQGSHITADCLPVCGKTHWATVTSKPELVTCEACKQFLMEQDMPLGDGQ